MKQGRSFAIKKGSLIGLACAAAFAMPQAFGAAPEGIDAMRLDGHGLTLSGNISIGVGQTEADGATAANSNTSTRTEVWTGESNFRLSGSTALKGSFFKAIGFQVESGIQTDNGDSSSSQGTIASRNTGVGLRTAIGDVFGGHWDTPYKAMGSDLDLFSSPMGINQSTSGFRGSQGLGGGTGGKGNGTTAPGVGGGNIANSMNFRRRNDNTFNYYSPVLWNFQVAYQFVPDEGRPAGNTSAPRAWAHSAAVFWENGPFRVGVAHEIHDDFLWGSVVGANRFGAGSPGAGAGTTSNDYGTTINASWDIGDATIAGYYEKLKWRQAGGTATLTELESDKWYIMGRYRFAGVHEVRAGYGQADDYSCKSTAALNCGDTGVKAYSLLYRYRLDRVSWINVDYTRYDNDRRGDYRPSGSPPVVASTSTLNPAGLTYTGYSIGIQTSF